MSYYNCFVMINIFNRFKNKKQAEHTPLAKIPWHEIVSECYDKGLEFAHPVVRVIYSDDKSERAVILQKSDMTYTVTYERLYPYDDEELKYLYDGLHGYWGPVEQHILSIFDTEEKAINEVLSEPPFK